MPAALPPSNEATRLRTLRDYAILDTAPEPQFDDLTRLASYICKTPIALISLIDERRQWFKSAVGLDAQDTHRDLAFCAHAIHQADVMVVPDATHDSRFSDNPLVTGDPKIRFYAGAPLLAPDGQAMGTICVIDREPRAMPTEHREALAALARQTVAQMELRKRIAELQRTGQSLLDAKLVAEEASRAKSRFLAHMSHELRTPLNAVIGFATILLKPNDSSSDERRRDFLQRISASGRHLLALIDSILDLSRIETGRLELKPEPVEPAPLLRELIERVEPLAVARGNTLTVELADDLGTIEIDRTKLSQCVLNLLSNACKFTEAGRIDVRAYRRIADGSERLRIEVEDTGMGIEQSQMARLFDEFARAPGAERIEGTGLGLAITRRLCRLMGGEITAKSAVGVGSTFSIDLPG